MIKLCDETSCTQCYSCVNVCPQNCIKMGINDEGFKYPIIDESKCIECGLCAKSCHILSPLTLSSDNAYPKVYAAWAKDFKIRTESSSGGLFTCFAEFILNQGGVVYGAAYAEDLKVMHTKIETSKDLWLLRESKYVISDIGSIFKDVKTELSKKRLVLFTGTPCQVAGLKRFLKKDSGYLYTCDLLCHGVPSYKSFYSYLQQIYDNEELKRITNFHFRYTKGWRSQLSVDFGHVRKNISVYNSYYLRAFYRGLMLMNACYKCRYPSVKRVGDITIGDFWNIGTRIPFKHEKKYGVSLLLVNNLKGELLLGKVNKDICYESRNIDEAKDGNRSLYIASNKPKERESYILDSQKLSKECLMKKYNLSPSIMDYLRLIKRWLIK